MHVFCLVTRLVHIAASMGVSFGASGWGSQRGEEHCSSRRIVPYMREPLDAYPTASPQCHTGHGGMGAGICPRARAGTSYGWGDGQGRQSSALQALEPQMQQLGGLMNQMAER